MSPCELCRKLSGPGSRRQHVLNVIFTLPFCLGNDRDQLKFLFVLYVLLGCAGCQVQPSFAVEHHGLEYFDAARAS